MVSFLIENLGTIVVGLIIACIVVAIVIKLIKDKQKGKCAGCDCSENCPKQTDCDIKH